MAFLDMGGFIPNAQRCKHIILCFYHGVMYYSDHCLF